MTSAENSNFENFLGKENPRHRPPPPPKTRLVPSALAIMPPVTKSLATALGNAKKILCHFQIPFKSRKEKDT